MHFSSLLLFLILEYLLYISAYCNNVDNQKQPLLNSTIFDSINKDLEEIKRALELQLNLTARNRVQPFSSVTTSNKIVFADGEYLKVSEEANKTGDKQFVLCSRPTDDDSIYKYSIKYLNQSLGTLDFAHFRGKPLLLVNVATFCESTIEYPLLNGLKDKFGDALEIIAFPSAQFANVSADYDVMERESFTICFILARTN